METKEFIEQHLKKIYENCPVYFDITENAIIIKNEISKEQKSEWDKKEPELRRIRIQLQKSREVHNKEVGEIRQAIQNNLNQIRNSYNYIKVGEAICSWGHDRDIKVYDKSGYLIPSYQSDFIGHIYCPTCGRNDYNPTLRNAKTYSLEEWSRENSQQATERRRKMQEAIDEQNRKEREIIDRINQERSNREAETSRNIQKEKSLREQIESQQQKVKEEILKRAKEISESKINSSSQGRIDELKRELAEKEQELEEHVRLSEARKNAAECEFYAYIEQRRN